MCLDLRLVIEWRSVYDSVSNKRLVFRDNEIKSVEKEWSGVKDYLLALDVGNTNTVVGLFRGGELKTDWRLTTHAERTADEVGIWLLQLLEWEGVRPDDLEGVAVSSVVPPMDPRLREGVARYRGRDPGIVVPGIEA